MTYAEMIKKAVYELDNNDDLFVEMVNELDAWNGYADGFRAYPMYELDELFCDCKVSEFLDKLAPGFNLRDEYMVDTIYGLDSTDDCAALYRDNVDTETLLDDIIDKRNHLYFSDSDFETLIDEIINYTENDNDTETKPALARVIHKTAECLTGKADPESVTA